MDYPIHSPKFFLDSMHSKIALGSHLPDLTEQLNKMVKVFAGEPCIIDIIEFIRVVFSH